MEFKYRICSVSLSINEDEKVDKFSFDRNFGYLSQRCAAIYQSFPFVFAMSTKIPAVNNLHPIMLDICRRKAYATLNFDSIKRHS